MKKVVKKQLVSIIAVLLIGGTLLTACSSSAEPTTETTTETVETAKAEEVVAEPTPEPTAEPTPEPIPEVIAYDGIDMESTLPGLEWIYTFEGIINEPKFVIFNDDTNKKVIVENGQEVQVEKGDTIIIYRSEGFRPGVDGGEIPLKMTIYSDYCEIVPKENNFNGRMWVEFLDENKDKTKVSCYIKSM